MNIILALFQGWAAVVANLEDTAMELQRRSDKFDSIFRTYLSQRERHKELIDVFDDDVALLHQVRCIILPEKNLDHLQNWQINRNPFVSRKPR